MFWLILAVLVWGLVHSLLASLKAKELARRRFGENLRRIYRLVYNLLAGLSFLPILVIAAATPDRRIYLIPLPWSVTLVIGELLAAVMLVVGFRQADAWEFLGLRQLTGATTSTQPEGSIQRAKGQLVKSGLYRYVRHPLYTAGMVFIWLIPLMTVNVLAINIALTIYVVIGAYFEERKLRHEFGQEYTDYAAITPMFVPFLKGNKTPR